MVDGELHSNGGDIVEKEVFPTCPQHEILTKVHDHNGHKHDENAQRA